VIAAAAPTSAAPTAVPAREALHLITREQPSFPAEAVRQGLSKGRVRVRLSIAVDGSVTHVEVLEATPHGAFDRAVVAATERWKYAPVPEPTTAIAEFDFHRDE
jgi:TonB family protein